MSDYSRFVSYMYLYENGLKTMNAGFVKVESRNGQCQLCISARGLYYNNKLSDTYAPDILRGPESALTHFQHCL